MITRLICFLNISNFTTSRIVKWLSRTWQEVVTSKKSSSWNVEKPQGITDQPIWTKRAAGRIRSSEWRLIHMSIYLIREPWLAALCSAHTWTWWASPGLKKLKRLAQQGRGWLTGTSLTKVCWPSAKWSTSFLQQWRPQTLPEQQADENTSELPWWELKDGDSMHCHTSFSRRDAFNTSVCKFC